MLVNKGLVFFAKGGRKVGNPGEVNYAMRLTACG
jgi:hypothetical protein